MYKPHFYKQNQAEIGKKIKQNLRNTPRLNLQKKPLKIKCVCFNKIIWL